MAVEMDFWGSIPYDEKVREAAMAQQPFLLYKPNSKASRQVSQLVSKKILQFTRLRNYLDRLKLKRVLSRFEISEEEMLQEAIICSVKCGYWDGCEYQNGGYPCPIRNLEVSLTKN